ncbi:MAG: Hint domain-containing protein [Hyphomicrobiaceae bacterium]
MSDDGGVAFANYSGSSFPVFTGNYYLLGLLLEGEISPATYFNVVAEGAGVGGFSASHFPHDASSVLESGAAYNIVLSGGVTGYATFYQIGPSVIALSDGRVITMFPWMTRNIVGGEGVPPCFAAATLVLLADGTSVAIEDISVGDCVAAFDECDAGGTGTLTSGVVMRLIPGITTEWIVLDDGTRVTPNHRYLRPDGTFLSIADILATDGLVVDAAGNVVRITGTVLHATDTGSDATWIKPGLPNTNGGAIDAAANDNAGAFQMRVAQAGGV